MQPYLVDVESGSTLSMHPIQVHLNMRAWDRHTLSLGPSGRPYSAQCITAKPLSCQQRLLSEQQHAFPQSLAPHCNKDSASTLSGTPQPKTFSVHGASRNCS